MLTDGLTKWPILFVIGLYCLEAVELTTHVQIMFPSLSWTESHLATPAVVC
jgi:hypothetical protein